MNAIRETLAYPSLDGITPDAVAARIIAPAYASASGELSAILQYLYHHLHFAEDNCMDCASLMEGIAVTEMHHFEMLGAMLLRLGVDPIYSACPPFLCNFFSATSVSRSTTPSKMLMDNITGELNAIAMYERMLDRLCNQDVAAVITRILLDEKCHLAHLNDALAHLSCTPLPAKTCSHSLLHKDAFRLPSKHCPSSACDVIPECAHAQEQCSDQPSDPSTN